MTSKHTPGPWVVHDHPTDPYQYGHHVTTADGLTVCSVTYQLPVSTPHGVEEATRVANARLIAAAPELLEALTKAVEETEQFLFEAWMVRTCPSGDHECVQRQWLASSDHVDFCREWAEQLAAIAKATGEV